jgi:hypothetical protein
MQTGARGQRSDLAHENGRDSQGSLPKTASYAYLHEKPKEL